MENRSIRESWTHESKTSADIREIGRFPIRTCVVQYFMRRVRGNMAIAKSADREQCAIFPALLRPGRLDRIIYVRLPGADTRKAIFKLKFRKMKIKGYKEEENKIPSNEEDMDLKRLVEMTDGYTCAELEAICNEAGIIALRENLNIDAIRMNHFLLALKTVRCRTPYTLLELYDKYIDENPYFVDQNNIPRG